MLRAFIQRHGLFLFAAVFFLISLRNVGWCDNFGFQTGNDICGNSLEKLRFDSVIPQFNEPPLTYFVCSLRTSGLDASSGCHNIEFSAASYDANRTYVYAAQSTELAEFQSPKCKPVQFPGSVEEIVRQAGSRGHPKHPGPIVAVSNGESSNKTYIQRYDAYRHDNCASYLIKGIPQSGEFLYQTKGHVCKTALSDNDIYEAINAVRVNRRQVANLPPPGQRPSIPAAVDSGVAFHP